MTTFKAAPCLALLACGLILLLGAWSPPAQADGPSDDELAFRAAASLAVEGNVEALKESANAGDPHAQYFLGAMYSLGREVDQDLALARRWLATAAESGHIKSQLGLGGMLLLGKGGPTDFQQGIVWLKRAADAGNSTAQVQLGRLYFEGAGDLPIDRVEAYVWFSLATINPAPDQRFHPSEAQHFLDDLEQNYMEEAEISEARARAVEKVSSVSAD